MRRRDTDSRLNALAGGRIFPGIHHHANFDVREARERFAVAVKSDDGQTGMSVRGVLANGLPPSSVFTSIEEASAFFRAGSLGYSATNNPGCLEGLELRCHEWHMEPLAVEEVQSSFFDDENIFPRGSIQFDCALLMRNIEHEWHGRQDLLVKAATRGRDFQARFDTAL